MFSPSRWGGGGPTGTRPGQSHPFPALAAFLRARGALPATSPRAQLAVTSPRGAWTPWSHLLAGRSGLRGCVHRISGRPCVWGLGALAAASPSQARARRGRPSRAGPSVRIRADWAGGAAPSPQLLKLRQCPEPQAVPVYLCSTRKRGVLRSHRRLCRTPSSLPASQFGGRGVASEHPGHSWPFQGSRLHAVPERQRPGDEQTPDPRGHHPRIRGAWGSMCGRQNPEPVLRQETPCWGPFG